jgi:ABC-type lipopolysaccharide export system ATPase subunit
VLETGTVSLAGDSRQLLRDDHIRRSYLGHQKSA